MSDIKMRDVFNLPLSRLMRDSVGNDLDTPDILESTAMSYAINSHDKLTEQNKILREALLSIAEGTFDKVLDLYKVNTIAGKALKATKALEDTL